MTINEESLKAWEQEHIEFLTSREMGEWLHRREINALRGEKERPQDKWGKWIISEIQCPNCFEHFPTDCYSTEELNKCPLCGEILRGAEE